MAFPKSSSSANKNTTVDATLARANTPPLSIFGSLLSSPCPPNPAIQSPLGPGGQPSNESQSPEVTIDSTTPLPSKVAQITFDPHGDVILVIPSGDDPTAVARFRVNSGVLCLASPVFRAMLNPHSRFKERANLQRAIIGGGQDMYSSTPMELPLKDDDPHAFAVVLRIMHLQFHKVPVSMLASGEDEEKYKLYEMAIICDKYDMKHMLSYWLEVWTRLRFSSLSYKNIAMSTTTGCRWLFIAYAFGYREVFHSVSKELILHCHVHSSGELFLPPKKHGGLDWMLYLPQSVIDEISAKRQQAIESFVDAVHNEIERYSNPLTNLCTFAEASCDAMMLGLLFRAFRKAKIYPEASDISRKSVEEVRLILQMIEFPENIPVNKPTGCCKSPRNPQATLASGSSPQAYPTSNVFGGTGGAHSGNPQATSVFSSGPQAYPTSSLFGSTGGAHSGNPQATSAFGSGPQAYPTSSLFGSTGGAHSGNPQATSAFGSGPPAYRTSIIFGSTAGAHSGPSVRTTAQNSTISLSPSPPVVTTKLSCANCQQKYKALSPGNNHAKHCLPLPRLRKNLNDIVAKVTGLEYSQFVRKGSDGDQGTPAEQASVDLWSTVAYSKVPKV